MDQIVETILQEHLASAKQDLEFTVAEGLRLEQMVSQNNEKHRMLYKRVRAIEETITTLKGPATPSQL